MVDVDVVVYTVVGASGACLGGIDICLLGPQDYCYVPGNSWLSRLFFLRGLHNNAGLVFGSPSLG